MKLMSYEQFAQKEADRLKRLRKYLGLSISEVEDTVFGTKSSVLRMEHNETPSAFRAPYLQYIYEAVMDEADYADERAIDIFRNIEFKT